MKTREAAAPLRYLIYVQAAAGCQRQLVLKLFNDFEIGLSALTKVVSGGPQCQKITHLDRLQNSMLRFSSLRQWRLPFQMAAAF